MCEGYFKQGEVEMTMQSLPDEEGSVSMHLVRRAPWKTPVFMDREAYVRGQCPALPEK